MVEISRILENGLPYLERHIMACRKFLDEDAQYDPLAILEQMLAYYSGIEGYNIFLEGDHDPEKWAQESYDRNTRPFTYQHHTQNNVPVRSKAEAMIGTQIERRGWVYRCEPLMNFGEDMKCPDFAVMLPETRRIIYIEHFGMMDDLNYIKATMEKLTLYSMHGLKLGENFFFTWETKDKPLNLNEIEAVLEAISLLDK